MGFRSGAWATVWEVKPISNTATDIRISISRKDKDSGEYVQDFSGFVRCIGTAAASKAAKLQERDRIKLGDTDVSTNYNKEKGVTYTNFKMFSFELPDESSDSRPASYTREVDDGEVQKDSPLPF